ncbi:hypothetical protein GUJ93_ZPchr0004g39220 [Zizania palustris]|uniref:Uncharacterized protein n=1 Tax=Zizania palustris TaxID=103762 RepID=A0A8J5SNI5_ZIZPA|nr:hypothetical protein GUJ93_ZPchr0004g39220 [Zizania palustris]
MTSWVGVVDMANTKLRKTSKGLWGAELPDLHGEDRLEAPEPKSSWIAGSSRRGSWHRFRGEICRGGCCDLGFGGWRLGTIYHRLRDLCFRLAREEPFWRAWNRFGGRRRGDFVGGALDQGGGGSAGGVARSRLITGACFSDAGASVSIEPAPHLPPPPLCSALQPVPSAHPAARLPAPPSSTPPAASVALLVVVVAYVTSSTPHLPPPPLCSALRPVPSARLAAPTPCTSSSTPPAPPRLYSSRPSTKPPPPRPISLRRLSAPLFGPAPCASSPTPSAPPRLCSSRSSPTLPPPCPVPSVAATSYGLKVPRSVAVRAADGASSGGGDGSLTEVPEIVKAAQDEWAKVEDKYTVTAISVASRPSTSFLSYLVCLSSSELGTQGNPRIIIS